MIIIFFSHIKNYHFHPASKQLSDFLDLGEGHWESWNFLATCMMDICTWAGAVALDQGVSHAATNWKGSFLYHHLINILFYVSSNTAKLA